MVSLFHLNPCLAYGLNEITLLEYNLIDDNICSVIYINGFANIP